MLQSIHLEFKDPASGEQKVFNLDPVKAFKDLLDAWRIKDEKTIRLDGKTTNTKLPAEK